MSRTRPSRAAIAVYADAIASWLAAQPIPMGVRRIQEGVLGISQDCPPQKRTTRAISKLLKEERIRSKKSTNGMAYYASWLPGQPPQTTRTTSSAKSMRNLYTIHARPQLPAKSSEPITVETDERQRALHYGTLFQRNGWRDVGILINGQNYTPEEFKNLP